MGANFQILQEAAEEAEEAFPRMDANRHEYLIFTGGNGGNREGFSTDGADERGKNHIPWIDISEYQRNPRRIPDLDPYPSFDLPQMNADGRR